MGDVWEIGGKKYTSYSDFIKGYTEHVAKQKQQKEKTTTSTVSPAPSTVPPVSGAKIGTSGGGGGGGGTSTAAQALRAAIEGAGGTVQWQGVGKPITGTIGGKTFTVSPSEYTLSGGTAYVSPQTLSRILGTGAGGGGGGGTGGGAQQPSTNLIALREVLQNPQWQGQGQPITGTYQGMQISIPASAYTIQEGRAYISPLRLSELANEAYVGELYKGARPETLENEVAIRQAEYATNAINWALGTTAQANPVQTWLNYGLTPEDLVNTAGWVMSGAQGKPPVEPGKYENLRAFLGDALQTAPMQPEVVPINEYLAQAQALAAEYRQMLATDQANIAAILAAKQQEFITQLDALQRELEGRMQEMMGGIDPATKAAITALREEMQQERNRLMDEMNRRGLLQSGIWAEVETRLSKGLLTEEERLVAQRVTDIQNQLIGLLTNFANAKLNAVQQFGIEAVQLAERQALARQQAQEKLMDLTMQMGQLAQQESQFRREQQRLREQFMQNYWLQLGQAQAEATGLISPALSPGYTVVEGRAYAPAESLRALGIEVPGTGYYALRDVLQNPQWLGEGKPIVGYYQGRQVIIPPSQAGQPTQAARQQALQAALAEAGVTGYYQGRPTLERESMNIQAALDRARLAAQAAGGGGGTASGTKPTVTQQAGVIASLADYYKTPEDFKADLVRYRDVLLPRLGREQYEAVLNWVDMDLPSQWITNPQTGGGPKFTPGKPSPMREYLKGIGWLQ